MPWTVVQLSNFRPSHFDENFHCNIVAIDRSNTFLVLRALLGHVSLILGYPLCTCLVAVPSGCQLWMSLVDRLDIVREIIDNLALEQAIVSLFFPLLVDVKTFG